MNKYLLALIFSYGFMQFLKYYKRKTYFDLDEIEKIAKENNKNLKKLYNILIKDGKYSKM